MLRTDIILGIMEQKGITRTTMAKELGITRRAFYSKLMRDSFYTSEFEKMAEILEIEVPWQTLFRPTRDAGTSPVVED